MAPRDTKQKIFIRKNFHAIWPAHLSGITNLLVQLRRRFDGDLDLALVLAVVGSRTKPERWVPALDNLGQMTRENDAEGGQRPINIQSVAAYTGIPRETVRRKVATLQAKGWITREPDGRLQVTRDAASDLQDATGDTIAYLAALLIVFERAQPIEAARNE